MSGIALQENQKADVASRRSPERSLEGEQDEDEDDHKTTKKLFSNQHY